MLRKLPFTLLCVFLLVQCTFGESKTNDIDNSSSKEESIGKTTIENEANAQLLLIEAVLEKFGDISVITIRTGKKLLQDVIADVSQVSDKPEEFRTSLSELEQFVAKLEKVNLNDQIAKFQAVEELSDLLERYNGTAPTNVTAPTIATAFQTSLNKNGLENAANEFVEKFVEFLKWFNPKAEAYWQALSSKEKVENVKFDVWFQEFKNLSNPEEQIAKFEQFFEVVQV